VAAFELSDRVDSLDERMFEFELDLMLDSLETLRD
jgi:hypothetical protein